MTMPFPSITRASLDSPLVFLALLALIAALMAVRDVPEVHKTRTPWLEGTPDLVGAAGLAALATMVICGRVADVLPILALVLGSAPLLRLAAPRLSMAGVLWLLADFLAPLVAFAWSCWLLAETPMADWTRVALLAAAGGGALFVLLGRIERIAREAVKTHAEWRRPIAAPSTPAATHHKVSVHLCCYAEPPEIVIATMNNLAALDFDDYEVLVCDNNTRDEALWRPLEAHCKTLNRTVGHERFRFFHVAPLAGAKAGALNFCLEHMARDAEIVAVIDADYLARPDFLSRLVPFFEDPTVGYLQTPHDYRDWEGSAYLTGCYWEYMPTNKVDYPGVSEYGGAFTIGTMCLLRAEGLRRIGGWAEWCLTEDSEVSVRLRAAGYHGIYLAETFGRGLIPETFDDYKKQRFRWTAGPVQQLRRHWRLFLPAPWAPPMPGWTKLLEVLRCVTPLQSLAALVATLGGLVSLAAALASGWSAPRLPEIVWALVPIGAATWVVRTRHRYLLSGCRRPGDMVMAELARLSLTYIVLVAGIAGLSKRPLAWRRTPKFALTSAHERALQSAFPETVLGGLCVVLMLAVLAAAGSLGRQATLLVLIGLAGLAASFLSATWMASLAVGHARDVAEDPAPGAGNRPATVAA